MAATVKKLILVRHAHRDKGEGRLADNGLSPKGRKQAQELISQLAARLAGAPHLLLSSPKQRCVETLRPLSREIRCPVRVFRLLDEQRVRPPEPFPRFVGRIRRFLNLWEKKADGVWVACSHGDWIPECLRLLTGDAVDIRKAAWVELEKHKDRWEYRFDRTS